MLLELSLNCIKGLLAILDVLNLVLGNAEVFYEYVSQQDYLEDVVFGNQNIGAIISVFKYLFI